MSLQLELRPSVSDEQVGGVFKLTPCGANSLSIVNPRFAMTSSPLLSKERNRLRSTSSLSAILPVYSEETKIT